ncbi:MAG: DUF2085 domain-containing protein [Firmicutes bacterium]|nr:DUF2085 domain-containing protein [Bacillota bacterium]
MQEQIRPFPRGAAPEQIKRWAKWMRRGDASGCHQLPERSLFLFGWQMPVCARCQGILMGQIVGLILIAAQVHMPFWLCLASLALLFVDWFIQHIGLLPSNNVKRLLSGLLAGVGQVNILRYAVLWLVSLCTN